jgi:hypothetical protein
MIGKKLSKAIQELQGNQACEVVEVQELSKLLEKIPWES